MSRVIPSWTPILFSTSPSLPLVASSLLSIPQTQRLCPGTACRIYTPAGTRQGQTTSDSAVLRRIPSRYLQTQFLAVSRTLTALPHYYDYRRHCDITHGCAPCTSLFGRQSTNVLSLGLQCRCPSALLWPSPCLKAPALRTAVCTAPLPPEPASRPPFTAPGLRRARYISPGGRGGGGGRSFITSITISLKEVDARPPALTWSFLLYLAA